MKLTVEPDGRVTGPAKIEYNDPFPCINGRYGSEGINGVLMHTMVGNLPGTIAWFNEPQSQASAHFGIGQDGTIHQFGPIGHGWIAWHAAQANATWYGIEHADDGNPNNPLTDAQLTASAQLVECLSAFGGFPLQVSDSPSVKGYGTHSMGGAAWGGHSCPDLPPEHVRSQQRVEIIHRALAIRGEMPPPKPPTWQEAMMQKLPIVKQGDTGPAVRTIQGLCGARGWPVKIDGIFGHDTHNAVHLVQGHAGLTTDGVVGPQTWPALMGIA